MHDYLEGLETTRFVLAFAKSNFWFGAATALHYFSLFTLTGTAVAFDLFLLGLVAKGQKATDFADQIFPWIWTAMTVAIITGFILTIPAVGDYYIDPVTRWKVFITLLAVLVSIFMRGNVRKWDASGAIPAIAKLAAVASILLWISAIVAGCDIAAISGLG